MCVPLSFVQQGDYLILQGGRGGMYCSDEITRVVCDRAQAGPWEKFKVVPQPGNKVALVGGQGNKYCSDDGEKGVMCNRDTVGPWELFTLTTVGPNVVSLIGGNGLKYCTDFMEGVSCKITQLNSWEKFTAIKVSSIARAGGECEP